MKISGYIYIFGAVIILLWGCSKPVRSNPFDPNVDINIINLNYAYQSVDEIKISWHNSVFSDLGHIYIDKRIDAGEWQKKYLSLSSDITEFSDQNDLFTMAEYRIWVEFDQNISDTLYSEKLPFPATPDWVSNYLFYGDIALNWEMINLSSDFEYFNVYRDGEIIANPIVMTYLDDEVIFGEDYNYYITAFYGEVESFPSIEVNILASDLVEHFEDLEEWTNVSMYGDWSISSGGYQGNCAYYTSMDWDATIQRDVNFPNNKNAELWVMFRSYSEFKIYVDYTEVIDIDYSQVEEDVWLKVEFVITAGQHTIKINGSDSGYLKVDELIISDL